MSITLTDPADLERGGSWWRQVIVGWPAIILASTVLAALSINLLPDRIAYDPYSWAIWGREIAHLHLNTRQAATAVKPLPMLFDTIFAFTGSHLPGWWLFAARLGTLLAFAAVFRLAKRLGGIPAAVVAVAGFAACNQLISYLFMRGMSEPMAAAATVAAVDYYLLRRYRLALACLIASAYLRPEAWPLLLGFLLWLTWRRAWWLRLLAVVVGVFVPFSWFLIDWFGARQFNRSSNAATHESQGGPLLHHYPGLATFTETWKLASGPVVVLFLVGLVMALVTWWRSGHSVDVARLAAPLIVSLTALAWVVMDAVLAQGHLATGAARYLVPATGLACAIAGWVVVELAGWVRAHWVSGAGVRRWTAPVLASVAIAALLPSLVSAGRLSKDDARLGKQYVDLGNHLETAIRLAGGRDAVLGCGAVTTGDFQVTLLAYDLGVPPVRIGTVVAIPGSVFQQGGVPRTPATYVDALHVVANAAGSPIDSWQVLSSC
jgi:hypothetical protein